MHVEFLVEDDSTAIALDTLLDRLLSDQVADTWHLQPFRGKPDMLRKLRPSLYAIARGAFADGVVVVLDADRESCFDLKQRVLSDAIDAQLIHRGQSTVDSPLRVRIAMSELESWFIGDPKAIRAAYGRLTADDVRTRKDVEELQDAWEWLQMRLIRRRYYSGRMPKKEVSQRISQHLDLAPAGNSSRSFRLLLRTLREVYQLPSAGPSNRSPST